MRIHAQRNAQINFIGAQKFNSSICSQSYVFNLYHKLPLAFRSAAICLKPRELAVKRILSDNSAAIYRPLSR